MARPKGKPCSEETKRKIGEANKIALKGIKYPNRKRPAKFSKEHREKISKGHKGLNTWSKGKKLSIETRKKISVKLKGEKSYLWKGGITPENLKIRNSIEFRLWREAVYARDNWTCQKYGIKGGKLHPHHILNFAQYPELRFAIDNGITFSEKAHKEFHKKYGHKNNNKSQLKEFLNKKKI